MPIEKMGNWFRYIVLVMAMSLGTLSAQNPDDKIGSFKELNIEYLEHCIKIQVDKMREEKLLSPLANDIVLHKAALDQVKFIKRAGTLSSRQDNPEKADPQLRVAFFGGQEYHTQEAISQTYLFKKIKRKGKRRAYTNETYEDVAKDIVGRWMASRKYSRIIFNEKWEITGCAIALVPKKKQIKVVQQFAWVEWKYNFKEDKNYFKYSTFEMPEPVTSFKQVDSQLIAKKFEYGLRPPKRDKQCKACEGLAQKAHSDTLPIKLQWKGRSIKIYTENLELVYDLFDDRRDGLAIEIVEYIPFDCGNGDYFFQPSRRNQQHIFNGSIQKPYYKRKLFKRWRIQKRAFNRRKREKAWSIMKEFRDEGEWLRKPADVANELSQKWAPKALYTKVGSHLKKPNAYYEINLLVIQNKKVCSVIHFNNLCGETIEQSEKIPFLTAFNKSPYTIDTMQMALKFTIPFEKGKAEYVYSDIKPLLDSIALENFIVKDATIKAYSSVEGNKERNEELQQMRAESIIRAMESVQVEAIPSVIVTTEDWDMMYETFDRDSIHEDWYDKSEEEIKALLAQKRYAKEMEPYLAKQRRAEVNFKIEYQYEEKDYGKFLVKLFHMHLDSAFMNRMIRLDHRDYAEALQYKIYKGIENGILDTSLLWLMNVPPNRLFAKMSINQIWLEMQYFPEAWKNKEWKQSIHDRLARLGKLKRMDEEVVFNYLNFLVKEWKGMVVFDSSMPPKRIKKEMDKLANTGFNGSLMFQLETNYHFKAANFYLKKRGRRNRQLRDESMLYLLDYMYGLDLNDSMALAFANFFVRFEQKRTAEEILYPFATKANPNHDVLIYYLKLRYRHPEEFPNSGYVDELIAAREILTEEEWCSMFVGPCNISFQIFDDERIRNLYCQECGDKENFAHDEDSKYMYIMKVVK